VVGAGRQRAIVEGEHHLMVFERQALAVLHGTEPGMLDGIHNNGATGPKCSRIAGALGRCGKPRREQCHSQNDQKQASHF
jgi:hypothetical protein